MVKSVPRPTLRPGCHFVPHCLTMMLPATTFSPPNFFTPRYCGLLSRPFLDEPTPFLCAIKNSLAELDVADLDFGEALTVTLLLSVVLSSLHFEDHDLFSPSLLYDLAFYRCALESGHADHCLVAVGAEDHVVAGNVGAFLTWQAGG